MTALKNVALALSGMAGGYLLGRSTRAAATGISAEQFQQLSDENALLRSQVAQLSDIAHVDASAFTTELGASSELRIQDLVARARMFSADALVRVCATAYLAQHARESDHSAWFCHSWSQRLTFPGRLPVSYCDYRKTYFCDLYTGDVSVDLADWFLSGPGTKTTKSADGYLDAVKKGRVGCFSVGKRAVILAARPPQSNFYESHPDSWLQQESKWYPLDAFWPDFITQTKTYSDVAFVEECFRRAGCLRLSVEDSMYGLPSMFVNGSDRKSVV